MVTKLIRFKTCQHIALLSQKMKSLEDEISRTELCCDFFSFFEDLTLSWTDSQEGQAHFISPGIRTPELISVFL